MKNVNVLKNKGVNIEKALELFGDMETYDEMLNTFYGAIESKRDELKRYKEASDIANYAILAHSIKSDARYFGFEVLGDIAYKHELAGKANNVIEIDESYNDFINEMNKTEEIVKSYLLSTEDSSPIVGTTVTEKPVILVADDSDIIRKFVEKIFEKDYSVIAVQDGTSAISALEEYALENIVALLLDLNMPGLNGFEVLNYFKEKDLFELIPVAIITGDDSLETTAEAFKYPIVDILRKPFDEKNIKAIVDKLISIKN